MKQKSASQLVRSFVEKLDWAPFRKPPTVADYELSGEAQTWLHAVPIHSRPLLLSRQFPRIANRLAALWGDAKALDTYIDDLLEDKRGDRLGFPAGIREEVLTLRTYVVQMRSRRTKSGSTV